MGYIVNANCPFTTFSDPYIRALLAQLDPDTYQQVCWSESSIRAELDQIFKQKQATIKAEIHDALTKIHFSFDLWTSPNRYAIIAIFTHFLDRHGKQKQYLIALRRQPGAHDGETIASTIKQVLEDWEITAMLGVAVCDNASSNDTCLDAIFRHTFPEMDPLDVFAWRIRCYGHILNLVGRAILYGTDEEAFLETSDRYVAANELKRDLEHWRSKGPVGKLHNVVKFIRASPQRCERFLEISQEDHDPTDFTIFDESPAELKLMLNNDTRWNSTYMMIQRALVKEEAIDSLSMRTAS